MERTVIIQPDASAASPGPVREEHVHYLVVVAGPDLGRRIALGAEPLSIGRAVPCDLLLEDSEVSRHHCRVAVDHGQCAVTDLNSSNGTFVDEQRVSGSMTLADGALLRLGRHVLKHEYRSRREVEASQELDRDLEKARRYVLSLLPAPIRDGPVRTDWVFHPSAKLGGDAFGYHALDERTFAGYVVDVSGHGALAAMHTVSVMNVLRKQALPRTDFRKPSQVLKNLNAMFQMDAHGGMFFTIWYGVYDRLERTLTFCTAGHHPAFLVPADKHRLVPLKTRNVAIGADADHPFRSDSVSVPPGAMLYVFSDGVFEIVTKDGAQWGLADFAPLILEPAVPDLGEPERLYRAVQRVAGSGALHDDFSLLVVTFN